MWLPFFFRPIWQIHTMYNVEIKNFKKISTANIKLSSINVVIGANNSGKSSFIQAIQFCVGCAQSLELKSANWVGGKNRTLSLDASEFLYSPTLEVANLRHGDPLTSAKTVDAKKYIQFKIKGIGTEHASIDISKGKNGGFTTSLKASSKKFGEEISSLSRPFCVYVPGIAGVPLSEKYEVPFVIKKSATRGDSNNFLRNILLSLSEKWLRWGFFTRNLRSIYPKTDVIVSFDKERNENINVSIKHDGKVLPLDLIGTGFLQIVQIFAYLEYFSPRIILLDEPDAHLHPTKQKLLAMQLMSICNKTHALTIANELQNEIDPLNIFSGDTISEENKKSPTYKKITELKWRLNLDSPIFVISTHSRYMLESLDGNAQVLHFNSGNATSSVENSKILQDIGAIDAEHLFANKKIKYIFCTEDKVDNIKEKKEFLKKIALASGYKENEFVLHSYESCTKVDFAKILKNFVEKQIPNIEIILHFDRDQRDDDDPAIIQLKYDCHKKGIKLFITKYSELENYYCQPAHLTAIYGIPIEQASDVYENAKEQVKTKSKNKIKDYAINHRHDISRKNGLFKTAEIDEYADRQLEQFYDTRAPGKELLGAIKNTMQNDKKLDPEMALQQSDALFDEQLASILREIEIHSAT